MAFVYNLSDKPYFFAMNGQTGKFIGNLPISKGKLVAYSLLGGVGRIYYRSYTSDNGNILVGGIS